MKRARASRWWAAADTLLVPLYGHAAAGLGAYNEPVQHGPRRRRSPCRAACARPTAC